MIVLGIDTSCDDTGVGVVRDGEILANIIVSQSSHRAFGGVMPEIASREHSNAIDAATTRALEAAAIKLENVDVVAATRGPGLAGALLVGFAYGKALAFAAHKKFFAIHHLVGHIQSALASHANLEPPYLALIVSGGHTHLFDVTLTSGVENYSLIGRTRDDAAGEAFDKAARLLGLGFPGGPAISEAAKKGNANAYPFPMPLKAQTGFDFSYSGLKNAMRLAAEAKTKGELAATEFDLAASFEKAVVQSILRTTKRAAKKFKRNTIVVSGGVAANLALRQGFLQLAHGEAWQVIFPPAGLNTDNGAMIALAGYTRTMRQANVQSDAFSLDIKPNWPLNEVWE